MSRLSKVFYRFNAISIKILIAFKKNKKQNLNLQMCVEPQKILDNQSYFEKEEPS